MDLLFIILMMFVLYMIATNAPEAPKISHDKVIKVVKERKCPPHRWRWIPMEDQEGKQIGERMVCLDCGPLRGSD